MQEITIRHVCFSEENMPESEEDKKFVSPTMIRNELERDGYKW